MDFLTTILLIIAITCIVIPIADLIYGWIMGYDDTDYSWHDDEE